MRSPAARARRRWPLALRSFTLIELMVSVTIMALFLGLVAFLPEQERNLDSVRSAAVELAATVRQARALAMDKRSIYGLSFNITNAPGSTGRIINNHSGQHWYQILAPSIENWDMNTNGLPMCPYPEAWWNPSILNICQWTRSMAMSWTDVRHYLPAHKVRFLALTDQDTGGIVNTYDWNGSFKGFAPTYPRPWFGYWDPATQRLYPWGGYDTASIDHNNRHCGGFFYEGRDGAITGCTDPASRSTTVGGTMPLYAAGQPRPLINGQWQDCCLLFYPDGTVTQQLLPARWQSWNQAGNGGGAGPGDLGDRSSLYSWAVAPMTNLSGMIYITLAPDVLQDTDSFASARDAYATLMPAYRVSISPSGMVDVIQVRDHPPVGALFDTSISDWTNQTVTNALYQGNRLTTAQGQAHGTPIEDFLTVDMLAQRQWWLQ
jgi:hypothetical protein